MASEIILLREQADNLNSCLSNLRNNLEKFPNPKEAKWLESMLVSSLVALENHIKELERLAYRDPMEHKLFRK